ncbi:MAG: tetratricopeptide repeat protein [Bacteroidota bacterium]
MKKVLLTTFLAVACLGMMAQKVDKAKDLLLKNKLAEAKAEIDGVMADAKNAKNGEAWFYKGKIYSAVAADNALGAQTPDAREQAFDAFKKYVELDDKNILLILENYKPIIDLYQYYFTTGAAQFKADKHADAYNTFKNCLAVSDYMSSKGWTNIKLDTTVILYTGISAEKAGKKDEAATYYARLAEAKVNGENNDQIYGWLAGFYAEKKDNANAMKFLNLAREVYPKRDSTWDEYEMQMIRESGDKKALFDKYENMLTKNPSDYLTLFNYSVELYQTAYDTSLAKRPPNSQETIAKVETNMKKVIELKPDFVNGYLVLGKVIFNQGNDILNESKKIRPQGTVKLKPDELKKKNDLRDAAGKKFDEAVPYFEKIDELVGSKGKLRGEDKRALKDAYDLLSAIYDNKGNKEKSNLYTDKLMNTEKVHS